MNLNLENQKPDIKISVRQTFNLDTDMELDGFSKKNQHVPKIDNDYKFDRDTTLAILSGFAFNKRVLIQGYHGTGKSTHIEQVAARLNWPCIRVNLAVGPLISVTAAPKREATSAIAYPILPEL